MPFKKYHNFSKFLLLEAHFWSFNTGGISTALDIRLNRVQNSTSTQRWIHNIRHTQYATCNAWYSTLNKQHSTSNTQAATLNAWHVINLTHKTQNYAVFHISVHETLSIYQQKVSYTVGAACANFLLCTNYCTSPMSLALWHYFI